MVDERNTRATTGSYGQLLIFLAIAFGWAWAFWVPVALHDNGLIDMPAGLARVVAGGAPAAWGPLIAAVVVAMLGGGAAGLRRLAGSMLRVRFAVRWYLVAILLIPAIVGAAQAIAALAGETAPPSPALADPVAIPIAFVWIFFLGGPLQEEAGWRGTTTPILQERWGELAASLATGLIWGLWHLPLFYMPREDIYYNQPIWGLMISTVLLSVLITWVYNSTGRSLFAAMVMHTSWNWANFLFTSLHTDTGGLAFLLLMVAAVVLVAVTYGPRRLAR